MWPARLSDVAQYLGMQTLRPELAQIQIEALSTDSRKVGSGELFVAIRGETHDGHSYVESALKQGAVAALVEKAWLASNTHLTDRCLPVENTTSAMRELGRVFRSQFKFPVIAVGGSNGKTTTKEMLACLLGALKAPITRTHKSENGFLGLAITLTQRSHRTTSSPAALVAEIGIDEVGAMAEHVAIATPDIALLTALGPEHLAGLGSWDTAVEEELILFRKAPTHCRRIWQLAEPRLKAILNELRAGDILVGDSLTLAQISAPVKLKIDAAELSVLSYELTDQRATHTSLQVTWTPARAESKKNKWSHSFKIPLPGLHNAQNFALALATSALLCENHLDLANAWSSFVPPEMRSRIIELKHGITLYDDCYNASPASMDAAFDALLSHEWKAQHKILVLGDMLDLGEESKSWHLNLITKLLKIENSDLCLFGSAMYDVYNEIKINHSDALRAGNIQLRHAGPEVNPASFLDALRDQLPGSVVLVKGSRGMDLGRFVKSCEAWSSAQG